MAWLLVKLYLHETAADLLAIALISSSLYGLRMLVGDIWVLAILGNGIAVAYWMGKAVGRQREKIRWMAGQKAGKP